MQNTSQPKTIAVILEDSEDVTIGKIVTDADQALISRRNKMVNIGFIKQFTKDKSEIEKLFKRIEKYIDIEDDVPEKDKLTAKQLATNLKNSYLKMNEADFKSNYEKFTGFMSNHLGIYTYLSTTVLALIQNI